MKRKGSSDVKGSLWNHLDKRFFCREAPLFLRVYVFSLHERKTLNITFENINKNKKK